MSWLRMLTAGLIWLASLPLQSAGLGAAEVLAQLPHFTASGTHVCGAPQDKRTCIVSGLFDNCADAAINLRTRDCCPQARGGGNSTGFTLNYCIASPAYR